MSTALKIISALILLSVRVEQMGKKNTKTTASLSANLVE